MTTPKLITADGIEVDGGAFTAWIEDYPKGALGLELSEALAECVHATQLHGKTSTLTMTVTIKQGERYFGELDVTTDVKTKPARAKAPTATFFPTEHGGLSRRDPNQPQIPGTED